MGTGCLFQFTYCDNLFKNIQYLNIISLMRVLSLIDIDVI